MSEFDFFAQAQKYYQKSPVIILGSGASAAFGLSGMGELSKHLVSTVDTSGLDGEELEVWERFKALLESGTDLESALHEIRLSETLTDAVVGATGTYSIHKI
ncbi:hypothetical protein QYZ38_26525 [Vibrio parahaemolyticus]|nr:hypothetical protein [Vibrio parahaemolyticus]